jgi:two-component system CheB/CheR fusion protein
LFSALNRKWKIYARQARAPGARTQTPGAPFPPIREARPKGRAQASTARDATGADLGALTERTLLRHSAAVGVLVDGRGEILHIHGRTGLYLEPPAGAATLNILALARAGLRRDLTSALRQAAAQKEPVRCPGLRVRTNGDVTTVDLTVYPAGPAGGAVPLADLFLVVLEAAPAAVPALIQGPAGVPTGETAPPAAEVLPHIAELESELRAKEDHLQSTLEEMATANEELTSTNEEMQSINEELQSTNEELETSKEELQSVNEELATVNVELQTKVVDLSQANNDMNNLLAGTGVATLFLDHQLRITRFTPASTQLIKLIQTDVGRPVGDLVSNLVGYDRLVEDTQAVLETLVPKELEVQTRAGTWHLLCVRPYRTLANVIEGAVITFTDISERKRMQDALQQARAYAEGIVEALREALVVLDQGLCVVCANPAFYRLFRVTPAQTLGRPFRDLGNGRWDTPELGGLFTALQCAGTSVDDYPMTLPLPVIGARTLMLNARRLPPAPDASGAIVIVMDDITERLASDAPPRTPGAELAGSIP